MLVLLFGSIIGVFLGLYVDFYLCIALCFLSIILFITLKNKFNLCNNLSLGKIFLFIILVIIFFVYISVEIDKYDTNYKPKKIEDNFKIISYANEGDYYFKYICKNTKGDNFIIYFPNKTSLKKGEVVEVKGDFVLPDLVRNTGGFNYRRYLNSQKIYGSIFVDSFILQETSKFNLIYYIQDEIYKTFSKLFPKDEMGLVMGMMIGETKDISEDILQSFKDTGITHLVAVSGSNVMYVLMLVQLIFNKICGKRKTYFISIIVLIIFMFISGASSSVIRATVMATLMILADIFYQKSDTINNISVAAFVLLLINPLIVFDVGCVLSFGGTLGIVLFSKKFEKIFEKFDMISKTLAVTCSAQISLFPIMSYYFNTISILAIITNLIVVPISGFITILGFVVFILSKIFSPLAIVISKSLFVLIRFTIFISNSFSKIPFVSMKIITPNILEIVLFYFLVFYLFGMIKFLNRKHFKTRLKISFFIVIIFIVLEIANYNFPKNYVEVDFIDVGQGDAIYIKTNFNKNILIDGGGSDTYDVGENILIPYLLDKRVLKIDAIFSSHSDNDHLAGILSVIKKIRVDTIYIAKNALGYDELYKIAKKKNIKIVELELGNKIDIDDLNFEVIGPAKNVLNKDVNAYSLVLKMHYENKSVLFTGDVDKDSEDKLQNVKSDILKVAHHGSNTSSSLKFIAKVNPEISVIQVGKNNKFGHPNKEIVERLKKYSKVYITANQGEIRIKIFDDKIKVE